MRTKLTESQVEQIILEETLDVLEEGRLDEVAFLRTGRWLTRKAGKAYKDYMKKVKADRIAKKASKDKEKIAGRGAKKAAEDGPEGLGTAGGKLDDEGFGLRTFRDLMGEKSATRWIIGALKSTWLFIITMPLTNLFYQTYEELIAPFFEGWGNDTSAALRISEQAEKKYLELITALANTVVAWEGIDFKDIAGDILAGPLDGFFGFMFGGAYFGATEQDLIGALTQYISSDWPQGQTFSREKYRRMREHLAVFHEIVETEGPVTRDGINRNYDSNNFNARLKRQASIVINKEEILALEMGLDEETYNRRQHEEKIFRLIDEFTQILDSSVVDELGGSRVIDRPSKQPATDDRGGSVAPTAPPQPRQPSSGEKSILKRRVIEVLGLNQISDAAQLDAWSSWAEAVRKRKVSTPERISDVINSWFERSRAKALEENRQLFQEVKLFTPAKGEFEFGDFKSWVTANSRNMGQDPRETLYNIAFLENLFRVVDDIASQKKALDKRARRMAGKASAIRTEIQALKSQLESEKDPKKKRRIQSKIAKLTTKMVGKQAKETTVKVSKKKLDRARGENV